MDWEHLAILKGRLSPYAVSFADAYQHEQAREVKQQATEASLKVAVRQQRNLQQQLCEQVQLHRYDLVKSLT